AKPAYGKPYRGFESLPLRHPRSLAEAPIPPSAPTGREERSGARERERGRARLRRRMDAVTVVVGVTRRVDAEARDLEAVAQDRDATQRRGREEVGVRFARTEQAFAAQWQRAREEAHRH